MSEQETTSITGNVFDRLRTLVSTTTVFGDPVERNGVTVIPASTVFAGGGGGGGTGGSGDSGEGGGIGLVARPTGAYVIHDDRVTWKPAISPAAILVIAFVAARLVRRIVRRLS